MLNLFLMKIELVKKYQLKTKLLNISLQLIKGSMIQHHKDNYHYCKNIELSFLQHFITLSQ